jgi:hypothetical protein
MAWGEEGSKPQQHYRTFFFLFAKNANRKMPTASLLQRWL